MYTKTKNKKTGAITEYQTQQYSIGCYLIINNDPSQQIGLDCKEEELHNKIRSDKKVQVLEKY